MNIIKFKPYKFEDMSTDKKSKEFFNKYLSGKYAYYVKWEYIFDFQTTETTEDGNTITHGITKEQYINYERNGIGLDRSSNFPEYISMDSLKTMIGNDLLSDVVDIDNTNIINSIDRYISINSLVVDNEIPIEKLKIFRTWLADQLLLRPDWIDIYTHNNCEPIKNMLNYYKNNMYDSVIKGFSLFPTIPNTPSITIQSGCDCGTSMTQAVIEPFNSICDPIIIYRTNIYNYMVQVFSDIEFWQGLRELCGEMKKYIDGIIKQNFPLASTIIDRFVDCTCKNPSITEQERLMNMLKELSRSLELINKEEEKGEKNFILMSLNNWAKYLYEKMYWK